MELNQKILLFDIETSPHLGYMWGTWEQNIIKIKEYGGLLCYSYKWFGEKKIHNESRRDNSEKALVKKLHALLKSTDIVVAHNGNEFDIKKANSFFAHYGLLPPNEYQKIDTLKIARSVFYFPSNKLTDLGEYLGLGKKIQVDKELWFSCMNGDKEAWKKMILYCNQDVALLEKIYIKLRPWYKNHPRIGIYGCTICGSKNLQYRGFHYTEQGKITKQRFVCRDCGKWGNCTKKNYEQRTQ